MAQPKKQSSPRKTGTRRSGLLLKLARRVNATSPVKVTTTKRETGKKLSTLTKKVESTTAKTVKTVKKTAPTKKVATKK